jgi:hypothetical protein
MKREARGFDRAASTAASENTRPGTFAPCVRGMAAGTYPCDGIDMMRHLSLDDLGLSFVTTCGAEPTPGRGGTTRSWAGPSLAQELAALRLLAPTINMISGGASNRAYAAEARRGCGTGSAIPPLQPGRPSE